MQTRSSRRRFLNKTAAAVGLLGSIGTASARGLENAPLNAQLSAIRGLTRKYRGANGIEKAFADGFMPMAPPHPNNWFLGRKPIEDTTELREPNALMYVGSGESLELGAVGYGVTHIPNGPPDLFNDEETGNTTDSEEDGWIESRNSVYSVFSNQDGVADDSIADLPHSVVFDEQNWKWVPDHPGETFDVDGDEVEEVLDFVNHKPPVWALHVWVHKENPDGLFSPWYETGAKARR